MLMLRLCPRTIPDHAYITARFHASLNDQFSSSLTSPGDGLFPTREFSLPGIKPALILPDIVGLSVTVNADFCVVPDLTDL